MKYIPGRNQDTTVALTLYRRRSRDQHAQHHFGHRTSLGIQFIIQVPRRNVLLIDNDYGIASTQALTLRIRKNGERLVHEHGGGDTQLPGGKSVAHGGAGTGASRSDSDDKKVNV